MDIRLENVLEYEQPTKYIVKSENYSDDFALPVLTAGKSFVLGYTDETEGVCKASENPVIIFDDFTADCKYVNFDFKVKSSAMKILHKANAEDNLKYYFYAMQAIDYTPFSHKRVWISEYSKFKIENRSVAEQNNIVKDLDTVATAIDNAKQRLNALDELVKSRFIEMFGDPITNSKNLPELTLPELGEFGRGVSKHRPRNAPELLGGKYPLIQTGEVANAELYINGYTNTYSELGYKQSKMWKAGTLCITIAANIAKTGILSFDACFPDSVVGFHANEKTNNIFIHFWFTFFQEILEAQAPASAQKNINLRILSELKVIVPPIELQNEFADFVKLTDKSKFIVQKQIEDLQELLDSKMDEYFG